MDLKVAFVVVCLCVLAITSTEAGIPKCCVKTKKVPHRVLQKVVRWDVQQNRGACDISALILYVKDSRRPICAHPKMKGVLIRLQQAMKRNKQKATY